MEWNFQKIEYFLRATEEKNLSEAARKMFFTPQALNKNLKQLETELGVKLINRDKGNLGSGGGMTLTMAGEHLKQCFMPCYQEYKEAVEEMERFLNQRRQNLKIAYFRGVKKNEMLMPLFLFLSESEDFESIELQSGELGEVLDWVESEQCDMAVTNIHDTEMEREELYYIPIKQLEAKILVSDKHPWARKDKITCEDMKQETMVVLKWGRELEKDSFWRIAEVKARKEVPDVDSMFAEIKTGKFFGVALSHFEGDYDRSFIQLDLPEEYAFSFWFSVIFRKDNYFQNLLENIEDNMETIWEGILQKQ